MSQIQGRGARRFGLGFTLVLLSVVAHSAAAGSLPSLPGLLGAVLVATALAFALGDRRRSAGQMFVLLLGGQVLLHLVMSAMGHHTFALVPDSQMLVAHIGAAAVAAILFAKSEALAMRWWTAARRILGAPELVLPRLRIATIAYSRFEDPARRSDVCLSAFSGRGPPLPT